MLEHNFGDYGDKDRILLRLFNSVDSYSEKFY